MTEVTMVTDNRKSYEVLMFLYDYNKDFNNAVRDNFMIVNN